MLYLLLGAALPGDADPLRHSSGIYDMDVSRVVVDLTTARPPYRASVHPLQKLLVAPIGRALNASVFGGDDRLAAARVLVATATALHALLCGVLAWQLARRSASAGLAAGLVCGTSFASLLAATVPESAALASVGGILPLVWLNARWERPFTAAEALVWAALGALAAGLTLTQGMHAAIALAVRAFTAARSGSRGRVWGAAALAAVLASLLLVGGAALQGRLHPAAPAAPSSDPIETERAFLRVDELVAAPARHTLRLLGHVLVFDFVAPRPAPSDYLMRRFGLDYWSLSIEEAGLAQWGAGPLALAVLLAVGLVAALPALRRADARFAAPALCIGAQLALHLVYGREYVLYAPHWHGVLVAVVVAAVWVHYASRRRWLAVAALLLSIGMLVNGVSVLRATWREAAAGLDASLRDERGALSARPRR